MGSLQTIMAVTAAAPKARREADRLANLRQAIADGSEFFEYTLFAALDGKDAPIGDSKPSIENLLIAGMFSGDIAIQPLNTILDLSWSEATKNLLKGDNVPILEQRKAPVSFAIYFTKHRDYEHGSVFRESVNLEAARQTFKKLLGKEKDVISVKDYTQDAWQGRPANYGVALTLTREAAVQMRGCLAELSQAQQTTNHSRA